MERRGIGCDSREEGMQRVHSISWASNVSPTERLVLVGVDHVTCSPIVPTDCGSCFLACSVTGIISQWMLLTFSLPPPGPSPAATQALQQLGLARQLLVQSAASLSPELWLAMDRAPSVALAMTHSLVVALSRWVSLSLSSACNLLVHMARQVEEEWLDQLMPLAVMYGQDCWSSSQGPAPANVGP